MNGILIIDDYGIWDGCKKTINEYFTKRKIKIFLSRVDESCRSSIKIS